MSPNSFRFILLVSLGTLSLLACGSGEAPAGAPAASVPVLANGSSSGNDIIAGSVSLPGNGTPTNSASAPESSFTSSGPQVGDNGAQAVQPSSSQDVEAVPVTAAGEKPSQSGEGTWCSARQVLEKSCNSCHSDPPQFGAPMPLVRYEDLFAPSPLVPGQLVYERVAARIHDEQKPMPPTGAFADTSRNALDQWLESGASAEDAAPECGSAEAPGEAIEEPAWPEDCEEFYTLTTSARSGGGKYVVRAGSEEHPQFVFDAPWGDDDVQILSYRPIVDNSRVLHHWILYEAGGFTGGRFLVGWAPGKGGNRHLPDDVGMYAPGGRQSLRLDMHYYNLGNNQDEPDASGLEVCIGRNKRKHTATVIGLVGNATAPVGRSDNTSSCNAVTDGREVRFLSVSPHMHKLGVHAKLGLTRDGKSTMLHDKPFSFEDQQIYDLGNMEIRTGDTLSTTCSYENNTGRTARFGENSDDEMCFNFVTYYPMGALRCGFAL